MTRPILLIMFGGLGGFLGLSAQHLDSTELAIWIDQFPNQDTLVTDIPEETYHQLINAPCEECPIIAAAQLRVSDDWNLYTTYDSPVYLGYSAERLENGLTLVGAFGIFHSEYFLMVFSPDATLVKLLMMKAYFGDAGTYDAFGVYDYNHKSIMLWQLKASEIQQGRRWGEAHDTIITAWTFMPDGSLDTLLYEKVRIKKFGSHNR